MLRNALARLRAARGARTPEQARGGGMRLVLPASMSATLGCDAVGVPARHGFRLMSHLPRTGCVFADADRWWWIVPAGSDLDLDWPEQVTYARDAEVPAGRPRLIHSPDGLTPYTPPIPLFLMVCQVTGVAPSWATTGRASVVSAP
ncbi:hypothetical protein ACIQUZ_19565 [Streptomyces griseus]|uniref:Uncharacterized protein n=1 Tax=Streptomyces griseus subsp. griseus (strain JCM 4626 / CBS 651.72 / NBRC 13350 / KCC S-0626 / ISP 5235) TaxID=455632 RepID=B1VU42_STRGG|nr:MULTISPECIES: hypothetical protein [Streptomyces]MYR48625.1 hypothetical protein [Streptomyces sp. SID4928]MYT77778.1 hypothetical protein [Streptomyces sp. SID8364]EGE40547.1 hypothetical protein SACT1_1177 [Streptomyces sp. ACT-1]MBW3703544.1 hypothetical protein [Streptomyces griseus]NEB52562.1 hypothetical protein [Streptomyces griseus]